MIPWATIRPALLLLIQNISGIDDVDNVVWKDQAQQYGKTQIRLKISSPIKIGRDEERLTLNVTTNLLEACIIGNRQFTWGITIESISQCDEDFALAFVENIRTGLYLESSQQALRAARLAVVRVEDTVELALEDDHIWSSQRLDVRMATTISFDDTSYLGHWIERVVAVGTFDGVVNPGPPFDPETVDIDVDAAP